MRAIPTFPRYRLAKPPVAKRWLGVIAALVLLSGLIAAMVRQSADANASIILISMVGMVLLGGIFWFVRTIFFRLSVHHSHTWDREAENVRRHWWEIHRRQFALKDIVLIGPAGAELYDWLRVIKREHQAPSFRQESMGKSLRIARSFSSDPIEREKQLAQMLVLQWKRQRGKEFLVSPEKYFWLGSPEAWQAFVAQLIESFPGITPPELPELWQGEKTLSLLANVLADNKQQANFLIAGCQSLSPTSDSTRPAGECAVLWLAGSQGDVTLSRGEFFDPSDSESLQHVALRAEKQSELHESPERCILFSHPEQPQLAACGWNVTHNIQDDYWGDPGKLDALVVISLAAITAKSETKPCGWIASDPFHTLALGIVKPHGNR
ncbi:hypothetical protein [Enterobacter sp. JBIWA005]|uniref:hypothetical protein n=1 Tax=Enterobacter sp. JBIWA005 TaxID=2831891 RepID=UPI001CC089D5|nr:hypothetical protein [Enterobacter sp. JBIWA005]